MIRSYGWSDALQRAFAPHAAAGLVPGRVIVQQRGRVTLVVEGGEIAAEPSSRLSRNAFPGALPVAGDWVAAEAPPGADLAIIRAVLPRATQFSRRAAGPAGGEQVVAANFDLALIVASLNGELNPRRLERYLAAAWARGAKPAILLTKADLAEDAGARLAAVRAIAVGVDVSAVSAITGEGLEAARALIGPGKTAALLGSSGVGKSTLINALLGEARMATHAIREDDARGRHTTSHRELVLLPGGGLALDSPGMRELGLWEAAEGLDNVFADIAALAERCRFRDCRHDREPGCAVAEALASGRLDEGRWRSFLKLGREAAFEAARDDPLARAARRRHWATINKANRRRARREAAWE